MVGLADNIAKVDAFSCKKKNTLLDTIVLIFISSIKGVCKKEHSLAIQFDENSCSFWNRFLKCNKLIRSVSCTNIRINQ